MKHRLSPLLEDADRALLEEVLAGRETGAPLPDAFGCLLRLREQGIARALSTLNTTLSAFRPQIEDGTPHRRLCRLLQQGLGVLTPRELHFSPSLPEPDRAAARLLIQIQSQTEKE